ncbi:hypothetical protein GUJ93_ZPchr0458g22777 [Zizania palustris]|uniref:VQ domain-containing protein n=1 Tax=Zizania palustris TaxID=103762 RepID=A0A8J5R0J7_ZIZPA|nr:hypothetical protein GUJ93_ZPchr0458g22777 [Zizania palustris]
MKHHAVKLPSSAMSSSSSAMGGASKLSHAIAKAPARKIRIVHVLAPEVIKTEARHFRELVQRLTGKPAAYDGSSASQPGSFGTAGADVGAVVAALEGAGAAATIKAEVNVEEDTNDGVFFQWLEDMDDLFSSSNMEAVSFW